MRDLRLPVEVDPWSDGRWSRFEREMFEKLDAQEGRAEGLDRWRNVRRRTVVAGGLAGAAAVALVVFLHQASAVHSRDRLRVATADSASQLTLGESSLTVAPRSLVMVSGDDDDGIDVLLDHGSVTCEVAPAQGATSVRRGCGRRACPRGGNAIHRIA